MHILIDSLRIHLEKLFTSSSGKIVQLALVPHLDIEF